MIILQLSDPHLVADPFGTYRNRQPLSLLRHGLNAALLDLSAAGTQPDLLLISGDLCQDESWGGYARLRDLLHPLNLPVALQAGNHDNPQLLRSALGAHAAIAPAVLRRPTGWLVLLESHRPGQTAGWIGSSQLSWLEKRLAELASQEDPIVVALHHPPIPIGAVVWDEIGLRDGQALATILCRSKALRAVLFGHIHQHWQGHLPGRPDVTLLGCPSSLCSFSAIQPCPLNRADDPGGRVLEIDGRGELRQRLLRWRLPGPPSLC